MNVARAASKSSSGNGRSSATASTAHARWSGRCAHGRQRLHRRHPPIGGLVRPGTCSDVQDSLGRAQGGDNRGRDPRVGLAVGGVRGADRSVVGVACAAVLVSAILRQDGNPELPTAEDFDNLSTTELRHDLDNTLVRATPLQRIPQEPRAHVCGISPDLSLSHLLVVGVCRRLDFSGREGTPGVVWPEAARARMRHYPGWWWSATMGDHVGHESLLERDRLML